MNTQSILNHWKEVRQGLFDALDRVTDEQLDFVPSPGLWSMRKVLCHVASVEEGWFRYDVTHEYSDPNQAHHQPEDYPTVASIKSLLTQVHQWTEAYLAEDAETKLAQQVVNEKGESEGDAAWVLLHVFEHEIHHRGEIFLMLGLMGIKAPDI